MAVSTPLKVRPRAAELRGLAGVRAQASRAGGALVVALIGGFAFAVFAHGAAHYPAEARLQVGLALAVVAAAAAWLWQGRLRLAAPGAAWAGIGLLAGFAAWSGLTLAWSIAPDRTWIELSRAIAYAAVVVLGVAAGSWSRRALPQIALGYLAVALLVALYALGGKFAPGLHIGGLIDLNQTGQFARLRVPLQYWNALALYCALATPIAMRVAVDSDRPRGLRLAGLLALALLFVTIGLTYSRGGVLATVVAVGVTIGLAGQRLRSLLMVGLALVAAAPALLDGFTSHDLTTNGVALSARETQGLLFGIVLLGSLLVLFLVGARVLAVEARTRPDPERSRRIGRVLVVGAAVLALSGVFAMAASSRGLTGTVSHQWKSFRTVRAETRPDPARLLTTNAGNRWVWWKEAAGAWSDRPLEGWGAGSFPVLHREYRTNRLSVLQPHSVLLQFLAETGLVGAALAIGGILLLLAAGLGAVRLARPGSERGLAAALWAAALAWFVHGFYDWDWDIPGVTIPALAFLGVLAAAAAPRPFAAALQRAGRGVGARVAALAGITAAASVAAIAAALPSWADSKTNATLRELDSRPSAVQLRDADRDVLLASKLNPLSVDPLLAESAIAERGGSELEARRYVLQAARRQPNNAEVWVELANVEFARRNFDGVSRAAARALRVDPQDRELRILVEIANLIAVPPNSSATATGTPLPAAGGA